MEDFYYSAIYDVLRGPGIHVDKMLKPKRLKVKIVGLNNSYRQRVMVDTSEQDKLAGENPSLYNLTQSRKRQGNRLISQIVDDNKELQIASTTILRTFAKHFQKASQQIETKEQCVKQLIR
jgi:hypothetical protein